mmetsp:Transcript_107635/g.131339  ORF Transcript_107635/g.131339 Transcript_107635/m.131339 type:complete len:336 (+) Transcript_107635:789-1796(+)
MSKRPRMDDDNKILNINNKKRYKYSPSNSMDDNKELQPIIKLKNEFDCPVCYNKLDSHIYQCKEGHLLCESCRPKLDNCPQCDCVLTNIRNRALENIISMQLKYCYFKNEGCDAKFIGKCKIMKHISECEYRCVKCPFNQCTWFGSFKYLVKHLKESHHACVSNQKTINNDDNIYEFVHAIKFPSINYSDNKSDLLWPKIIVFENGECFFVLTRFTKLYMSSIVRKLQIPSLSENELNQCMEYIRNHSKSDIKPIKVFNNNKLSILGEYSIELRSKTKETVLKWPNNLYSTLTPLNHEKECLTILKIPTLLVKKYWQKIDQNSAVMRLYFIVKIK